MSKRKSLDNTLAIATAAKTKALMGSSPAAGPPPAAQAKRTTSINIPPETLKLLQTAALRRTQQKGGRISISALLVEFIELHRAELEG
jgi:hypothetical protein